VPSYEVAAGRDRWACSFGSNEELVIDHVEKPAESQANDAAQKSHGDFLVGAWDQ
jgi:hypothetical protein